jgi:HlyD family secretion protein
MMKKWWMVLVVSMIFLSGCGALAPGADDTTGPAPALAQEDAGNVIAEGVIEPVRWDEVLVVRGGVVTEVLVVEGATATEGEVLVRLDAADATLALQEAQAALAQARADLAQAQAGPLPEEIAEAEAQIDAAQAQRVQAVAQRDELAGGGTEADVAAAQAQVEAAEAERLNARIERDRVYDDERSEDEDKENADYRLYAAREALAAAQANLEAQQALTPVRLREARSVVRSASAQEKVAQARLAQLSAGSRAEEVEIKQALVRRAEIAVAQAELALVQTEIRAPFAGTVTQIDVERGERVSAGQPVLMLAALDRLRVRTTDLTELDMARIAEGQPVVVTVDALPDVTLAGYVERIHGRSVEVRGDVTYPVYVALEETAPALRWGMTTMVEIEPTE